MDNIQNLLKKYGDEVFGDRYYEAPKIPEKNYEKLLRNLIIMEKKNI